MRSAWRSTQRRAPGPTRRERARWRTSRRLAGHEDAPSEATNQRAQRNDDGADGRVGHHDVRPDDRAHDDEVVVGGGEMGYERSGYRSEGGGFCAVPTAGYAAQIGQARELGQADAVVAEPGDAEHVRLAGGPAQPTRERGHGGRPAGVPARLAHRVEV